LEQAARGPYTTTPIAYGKYLYVCSNAGILTCYLADTGKEVYKERLGGVSYTASPVAADGRLYFTSEQGEVRVVQAGPTFELLVVNELGDPCMATPAISGGTLLVRSQHVLFALGRKQPKELRRVPSGGVRLECFSGRSQKGIRDRKRQANGDVKGETQGPLAAGRCLPSRESAGSHDSFGSPDSFLVFAEGGRT
jgi:hypothetical protein